MQSAFPGMDPWLESPYIWPDFHNKFASTLHSWLNENLPRPYYARLEMRPEVGIVDDDENYSRRNVPDVSVARRPKVDSGVAVAELAPAAASDSMTVTVAWETLDHTFVEVRDPSQGHHLVTLVEIVSPANKHSGPDRDAYLKKQTEVLGSDANLIELDFLRRGRRLFAAPELFGIVNGLKEKPDYVVLVNRAAKRRGVSMDWQIFPFTLHTPLPRIHLPLRSNETELLVDLQGIFQTAYQQGPYSRGAVDYAKAPDPPLPPELAEWAAACLRQAGVPAD